MTEGKLVRGTTITQGVAGVVAVVVVGLEGNLEFAAAIACISLLLVWLGLRAAALSEKPRDE